MTEVITQEFTMDPNLLVSVIKSQAGTLPKALLEGVMNSLDAGATSVNITLTETTFEIVDDGRGFNSSEEIRLWFGRFGTPHKEGDSKYGKFRMGRGQLMAFSKTRWLSNEFCMTVDLEKNGLTYDLSTNPDRVQGCRVEGTLYSPLSVWELKDTLTELRKFVLYTPKPVYVNGELYGSNPALLKTWTDEDEYAYYRVVQDCDDLEVYNQGVYVQRVASWQMGMGGVIVSKQPLEVNFARNSILEYKCSVWKRIQTKAEKVVIRKLADAKKLSEGERSYLARRAFGASEQFGNAIERAKIVTDPLGRHSTLASLRQFTQFVYVAETGSLACTVHGRAGTFVVTDSLLSRFGLSNIETFIDALRNMGGVLNPDAVILKPESISQRGLGGAKQISVDGISPRMRAGMSTLSWLNREVAFRLTACGYSANERELLLGFHKQNDFVAWTDGKIYITVNKHFMKILESGLDGAWFWAHTLVHEYMHDCDDSESHSHGEVFYQKFHDAIGRHDLLSLGTLAQQTVVMYMRNLSANGIGKPNALKRQLRPAFVD